MCTLSLLTEKGSAAVTTRHGSAETNPHYTIQAKIISVIFHTGQLHNILLKLLPIREVMTSAKFPATSQNKLKGPWFSFWGELSRPSWTAVMCGRADWLQALCQFPIFQTWQHEVVATTGAPFTVEYTCGWGTECGHRMNSSLPNKPPKATNFYHLILSPIADVGSAFYPLSTYKPQATFSLPK